MNFVAIDVETSNHDISSICQVGIAIFRDGAIAEEWSTLVDPEEYFDSVNMAVHGITPQMVSGKPKFHEIADHVSQRLAGSISICHTAFDRTAITRAYAKHSLIPPDCHWLDSSRVVRRTWKELAWSGYGLINVCEKIGYPFKHHDALEDAKAAGHIMLAAIIESKIELNDWKKRVNRPIDDHVLPDGSHAPSHQNPKFAAFHVHRDPNPQGDLFGEVVVFTGALELPRAEAADLAASVGCQVDDNLTKRATILVVGVQDISRLAGHDKSTKQVKAEDLAAKGHKIRILSESDFKILVTSAVHHAHDSEILA